MAPPDVPGGRALPPPGSGGDPRASYPATSEIVVTVMV
jgi:hypothetical protein